MREGGARGDAFCLPFLAGRAVLGLNGSHSPVIRRVRLQPEQGLAVSLASPPPHQSSQPSAVGTWGPGGMPCSWIKPSLHKTIINRGLHAAQAVALVPMRQFTSCDPGLDERGHSQEANNLAVDLGDVALPNSCLPAGIEHMMCWPAMSVTLLTP